MAGLGSRRSRTPPPASELYTFLQRAMLDLEAQPESLELVVASGGLLQLSADVAGGERVCTHLITQSTVVERHAESGDLLVRLNPDAGPSLEDTQLLTGLEVFEPSTTRNLHESLATQVASPVDPAARAFFKDWADRALTLHVDVVDRADETPSSGAFLTPSPALVLRKRGASALIEYYTRMTEAVADEANPVPLGLAQLVEAIEPADRVAWLDRIGMSSARLADDPLFPLPANEEQCDIIDRFTGDIGVVVEGPPRVPARPTPSPTSSPRCWRVDNACWSRARRRRHCASSATCCRRNCRSCACR